MYHNSVPKVVRKSFVQNIGYPNVLRGSSPSHELKNILCLLLNILCVHVFVPKRRGHTEGVLRVSGQARCSFKVVSQVGSILPVNFRVKLLL